MTLDDTDWALRRTIYTGLATTGAVPSHTELAAVAGGSRELENRLATLHSLAIPAALGIDAEIEAPWLDDGSPVELRIVDGELEGDIDAYIHFVVPARRWWDNIVET